MKKPLAATVALLLGFIVAAIVRQNHEFLFYAATLVVGVALLIGLDRRFDFTCLALWGFNVWLLLHLLGGMASIDGVRLYDYMLIAWVGEPYQILRYDQLVHFLCYVAIGILVYEAASRFVSPAYPGALAAIAVLAASGIGGLNEVIEFSAVVFLGSTGVGGYTNTALDLVANLLGALAAATFCTLRDARDRRGMAPTAR